MIVANLVKEVREEYGISQADLALNVGVTQSTWSKYENAKIPIPPDIANSVAKVLKSKRIKAVYAYQRKDEFFNVPLLDNVDANSVVVLDSLIEESIELIESCRKLKKLIRNKRCNKDLSPEDLKQFEECNEQIADVYPALKLHLLNMYEHFNLDIDMLEKKIYKKLTVKKYVGR